MQVRRFTGYSSQADQLLIDPSKLSQALNVCINNGAICNLPYPLQQGISLNVFPWADNGLEEKLIAFWIVDDIPYMVVLTSKEGKTFVIAFNPFDNSDQFLSVSGINAPNSIFPFLDSNFGVGFPNANISTPVSGNLIQIGSYLYYLSKFGETGNTTPRKYMPKLRRKTLDNYRFSLNGVPGWRTAAIQGALGGGGSITGTLDFAFTMATQYDFDTTGPINTTELGEHDIESGAIILDDERTYSSNTVTIRIYYQLAENIPAIDSANTLIKIGIYTKSSSQAFYYFTGFYNSFVGPTGIDDIGNYFEFTLSSLGTQDLNITAPGIGDNPTRLAPNQSYHGAEFKSRFYYANMESNQLEFSQIFLDDSPHKKEAQYIEGAELIGDNKDNLSGVIVYLGQLILFKENSTYVLTDEITQGQIRELFNDKGCVNVNGGHAYIVVDDILYFLDKTGLYAWNGQGDPIRISNDIAEDLYKINKKQYKFARLSIDPRYKLLYLTFPKANLSSEEQADVGCFIYHYGEIQENGIGVWTKMTIDTQLSAVLVSPESDVYYNRRKKLERLGFIDSEVTLDVGGRIWAWQTGILDFGHPVIDKHIRHIYMYLYGFLDTDQYALGYTLKETFQPDKLLTDIITAKDQVRLGFTAQKMILSMNSYSPSTTRRAFRIGGYDIVAHKKGR